MKETIKKTLLALGIRYRRAPRAWRPTWLPRRVMLNSEALLHPHVPAEQAEKFLAYNTGSTEIETLNWLHATLCLLKPQCVLETGAANGLGTLALASACRDNGFGCVHSVEIDPAICVRLQALLDRHHLADFARVHCAASFDFLEKTDVHFDFGFFDSLCEIRAEEYEICMRRGLLSGPAAFHDTSALRTESFPDQPPRDIHLAYRQKLLAAAAAHGAGLFEHRLGRGLVVLFPPPGA